MSIEDLNISAVDADQAVTEFSSEFQADSQQTADIEVAQAIEDAAAAKSDRLPPEAAPVAERPKDVVPDQNNIARLPANVTVDEIRVEGANLILVQADGTEVTVINGALRIPTFIIGDVEVPQQVLLAVLEQDGVNVAAGPDGSYSATSSGPQSSGGDFNDSLQQSTQEAGPLADLLANTELDDPNGDGGGLLFDDTPIITETALNFITETANAAGTFESQSLNGIFGFVPGRDTGQIASIAYVNTLNVDEPAQTGTATALTSGGVPVVVTASPDGLTLTGTAGGVVVFTLTVTDTATGAFTFQQLHALDHPDQGQRGAEDLLRLQFTYTVTDKDGDTVIGNASIDIQDDGPVAAAGTASTVEDEAVNAGNNEVDGLAAGVSGVSLNINWGADSANAGGLNDRSVAFTSTTVAVSGASGEALTSLGLAVKTVLINGVLVGYTGETTPTAVTGEGSGNVVFFASVSDVANGTYDFTLVKPLDHAAGNGENSLSLTFNYTATDSDGDTSSNTFTVNVVDDAPVANVGTASTVEDEAVNGGNNEVDGLAAGVSGVSLNINWGADKANAGGLNDRSVAFTSTTVAVSGASSTALTSLGLAVSTVLINGVLVGYTGETTPTAVTGEGSSNVVFFASVSDVANGTYDFTLVKPLDHAAGNGENSLSLTFNYTATDSDGDTSSNTFTVNVVDDAPVANVGTASTVEDEAVNGGNNEVDGLAAGVSGVSLNINWGSDNANAGGLNDRSVAFTSTTVAVSGASGEALTSLGLAVKTVLIDGVLVGYTGETAPTAVTGEGSGNVVFFASVSDVANGTYDFTLVKPLDHAAGNGENSLSLTFNYTATDSDGDTSSNTFTVTVVDDAPVANVGTASTVEDEAVNGGNNEVDGLAAGVSGVSLNINWGADSANAGGLNDRSVAFTSTTVAVSGASGEALTSLGLAVKTVLINGVLVGYTGETAPTAVTGEGSGNVVFFASVSDVANGTYDFTLVKPLDHAAGNGENSLSLTFNYTATDSDGDTSSNTFTVNVVDDAPVANVGTASTVEDEAVNGGNNEVDGLAAGVSGVSLNINWGADKANAGGLNDRSVAFTSTTVAVSGASSTALTSLGLAVSTVLINGVLVGYTGETTPTAVTGEGSSNVVFFASVSDVANGTYDFTLVKPLDHAAGNGENSLSLTFNYTATDSDGDTSSNTFTVNVVDDAPVAAAGTASTVEDEAVNGGNNEVDGLAAGVSGVSLNINWGADSANAGGLNDRSVAFTSTTVAVSGASGEALTSLGLAVKTVLIDGVLVGYTGETAPTAVTGEGSGNVVFFASVSDVANGTYDFTLVKPLDHAAGNGENSLSLTFNYTATDSDGDTSSNTFTVNVVDDAPVANVGTASTVEDEAVNGGNNEVDGLAAGVSGVSLNINWGADSANAGGLNDRSVAFTSTTVAVSGASGDSFDLARSGGQDRSDQWRPGRLHRRNDPDGSHRRGLWSNVVFFASVSDVANGTYDFTLVKPLDHAAGNGENSLSLTFNYTATDSDGDTSSNTFTVNVVDDAPVANVGTASTVEDEAVNGGNNEVDGLAAGVSGVSLNINWGADKANAGGLNDRSVAFTNTTVAVSGASSTALTSLGLAVSTVLINGVLVGYTGETTPTAVTGEGSGPMSYSSRRSPMLPTAPTTSRWSSRWTMQPAMARTACR
jgi:T1SS-143 domain-containing protein